MPFFKRLNFFMLAAFAASLVSLLPLHAAWADPDPAANPVLASIQKMGAKLYYLGSNAGLEGWFIVKEGRVQIAYSTPDKKGIVIGALFGPNGDSITGNQVKALVASNNDVATLMNNAMQEQATLAANNVAAAATSAAKGTASLPSASLSPGERLMQDLTAASGVQVGTGKAQLFMVMDPNCPHCQATWKALRPSVMQGVLQIRMIPIGTKGTDNERAAAQFLHVTDPLNTWDKYVGGDKSQLAGTPDATFLTAVQANHTLVDNWSIQATPYMVYRGKDGKVKVVQGELDKPEKVSVLLSDLGS